MVQLWAEVAHCETKFCSRLHNMYFPHAIYIEPQELDEISQAAFMHVASHVKRHLDIDLFTVPCI